MRLFVGVWVPEEARLALTGLPRPELGSIRWIPPEQLHVTLRFLGEVATEEVPPVVDLLGGLGKRQAPRTARIGPATRRLGRRTLVLPVAGLDELAGAVVEATSAVGRPVDDRPFAAHLTLARSRGGEVVPSSLAGQSIELYWPVHELVLVRSHLAAGGPRYETLVAVALSGPG